MAGVEDPKAGGIWETTIPRRLAWPVYMDKSRNEDIEVGIEEAMTWLPSHILHEAVLWEEDTRRAEYGRRAQHIRTKKGPKNGGVGGGVGHGMRAVFLDYGEHSKPNGTGVFLPPRAGTSNFQKSKPACSPVLLPARVVKALNLNVHDLGLQISRKQDTNNYKNNNNYFKRGDSNHPSKNKVGKDDSYKLQKAKGCSSTDIFLPKEWTY